ncbi:MAG: hypothetical protein Q9157_002903 [Trypethelium eluteriae]
MAAPLNGQDIHVEAGQDEQSDAKTASSGLPPYKSTVTPSSDPKKSEPKYKIGGLPVSYTVKENGKRVPKKYNVVGTPDICGHYEYVLQDDDGNYANNGEPVPPSRLAFWVDKSDKK